MKVSKPKASSHKRSPSVDNLQSERKRKRCPSNDSSSSLPSGADSSSSTSSSSDTYKARKRNKIGPKIVHKHRSSSSDLPSNSDSSTPKKKKKKRLVKKKASKSKKKSVEKAEESTTSKKAGDSSTNMEASNDVPLELMDKSKCMAPMTKEQYDKQQSVVKRVYDETSGRHRLIKGDGEVVEEIVSKDRHKEINKKATQEDGDYFQRKLSGSSKKI